jgi:hypothetical protein
MFFLKKVPWTPKTRTLVSGNPWHQKLFKVLRGKTRRKLCCARSFSRCARHPLVSSSSAAKDLGRNSLEDDAFGLRTTHNDFLAILARLHLSCMTYVSHLLTQNRKRKSKICCLTNIHIQSKWLCLVVANYSFCSFANKNNWHECFQNRVP